LFIGLLVKLADRGPMLFGQTRIGQFGKPFRIWKFRSMAANAERFGPQITRNGDPRITRVGRFLRKSKLDELPQLWNVLRGEMSMVGPRPEVPRYVATYTAEQRKVLALQPGITDLATLEFRHEEELLGRAVDGAAPWRRAGETEKFYVDYCLPRKIELNLAYAKRASVWEDTKLILRTLLALVPGRRARGSNR